MHYFEFGVTPFIDWRESETVYVKAPTSGDAIKFMHTLTDEDDNNKPYADFKYRTSVPEACLLNNVSILDATEPFVMIEITKQELDDSINFLEWYTIRLEGIIIGIVGRNTLVEETYNFTAYTDFPSEINFNYTGNFKDLDAAKEAAYNYALFLKS